MTDRCSCLRNCSVSDVQAACLTVVPVFISVLRLSYLSHDRPVYLPTCLLHELRRLRNTLPSTLSLVEQTILEPRNRWATLTAVFCRPPTRRSPLHRVTGTEPVLSSPDLSNTVLLYPLANAKEKKLSGQTGTNLITRIEHFV